VKGEKLVREKGRYSFDIYRAGAAKTELHTDTEIFTCPSCASSLSILDGGHCKFCGNTTDLSRYGWVLGAVKAE
jgi:translation initiation factor 2 gamma subunit (eIF-2gamma)